MKIEYSILALVLGLAYAVVRLYFPDVPITEQGLLLFTLWALAKLGVEVTAPTVRGFLVRRGFMQADLPVRARTQTGPHIRVRRKK